MIAITFLLVFNHALSIHIPIEAVVAARDKAVGVAGA